MKAGEPPADAAVDGPTILYIAGYGRSGSTVLTTILGGHPRIASLGEVRFLFEDWANPARPCACGAAYPECVFWRDLLSHMGQAGDAEAVTRRVERFRSFPRRFTERSGGTSHERYAAIQRRLFLYAAERSGKPVLVDASKSAWATAGRALALSRISGFRVFVIHLVRSGPATLESVLSRGSNWALEGHRSPTRFPAVRTALGWMIANLCAGAVGWRLGPDRYCRIRYEDFLVDPESELERVGRLLNMDMEPLLGRLHRGDSFQVGHVVGGNRVRFEGTIRLERRQQCCAGSRVSLFRRLPFAFLGAWLNWIYGYRNRRTGTGEAGLGSEQALPRQAPSR